MRIAIVSRLRLIRRHPISPVRADTAMVGKAWQGQDCAGKPEAGARRHQTKSRARARLS